MIVIGLHGPMYSGKSTVAKMIVEAYARKGIDCRIISMASPLKRIASSLGWNGLKDKKGRRLLQLLGTEVCRKCIDDDYWIDRFNEEARQHIVVVCDDIRFDNETKCCTTVYRITGRDPLIWRLTEWMPYTVRRIVRRLFLHPSELGIRTWDKEIPNTTLQELEDYVDQNIVR